MRLIDADAFEKQLNRYVEYNDDGKQEINADTVFITLYDQPTIEVNQGGDLISRQEAIDAVEDWFFNTTDLRQPIEVIHCLPSAQPETCEGCKHLGRWETEVEYGYNSPCTGCRRRARDKYAR